MSQASPPARPHPYLLTTPTRLGELRQAIRTNAWQAQNWLRLKAQADKLLLEEVSLPPRAGNWEHFYLDTISGTLLQRGEQSGDWQWVHRNPKTGQLFRSNPNVPSQDYDGVVLGIIHDTWALGVLQLGLAYQLSQDARYATKARQILLAYADLYPKLPKINRSRGRNPKDTSFGKVHVQTLDEATWLIGYDANGNPWLPTPSPKDYAGAANPNFAGMPREIINSGSVVKYNSQGVISTTPPECP